MQRISMGNRFNTEQGNDLSRHTASQRLTEFGRSAVTKPLISRQNQKARLVFAEEHVV